MAVTSHTPITVATSIHINTTHHDTLIAYHRRHTTACPFINTMSDPTAVSVILDPLVLIFNGLRSIHWRFYFSWAVHLIALPLRLLLIPLRLIASALFVLFSPALYILGYIYGCVTTVLGFLASLEVSLPLCLVLLEEYHADLLIAIVHFCKILELPI